MLGTIMSAIASAFMFLVYFFAIVASLNWLATQILGTEYTADDSKIQRPLCAVFLIISLGAAYLMTFERPIVDDCRPAGPAIYNDC